MLNNSQFRIQELDRRTLSWWRTRRDRIDMNPPYQRKGRRWSKSDKQYLIDSIINGFDVPKLYFSDFTWGPSELNDKSSAYAVIDGKQRLEAIFEFFDGKLALSQDFVYIQDSTVLVAGLTLDQLRHKHPNIAEDFENFNPIVMGVVTSEKRYIEELFVRLNRSRSLTGAEVRNAMPGPMPELFRQVANHEFFVSHAKFPDGSGQMLNLAAKIFLFETHGGLDNTKKTNLDRLTSAAARTDTELYHNAAKEVFRVLDEMAEIFVFSDKLLNTEGSIPVYYWLVRNSFSEDRWLIRDFLNDFSDWLLTANSLGLNVTPELANDLAAYETALRSVNDKSSHEKRYEILIKWFRHWIAGFRPTVSGDEYPILQNTVQKDMTFQKFIEKLPFNHQIIRADELFDTADDFHEIAAPEEISWGNKVAVNGIPLSFLDRDLLETFSKYGPVISAKVLTQRDTGRSTGLGFVEMRSNEDARKAIHGVNGQSPSLGMKASPAQAANIRRPAND